MGYESELHFLMDAFQKCRLQTLLLDPDSMPEERIDLGFRQQLGIQTDYEYAFDSIIRAMQPNTIYKLTDQFLCSYLFFQLPDTEKKTILEVGPYLAVEVTQEQMLEQAERSGLPPVLFRQLEKFYNGVPVLLNDNPVFALLNVFCERIWGSSEAYSMVDINKEMSDIDIPLSRIEAESEPGEMSSDMRGMENRYARENEMLKAVSQGLTHKAEMMIAELSRLPFERRLADPIRNMKNYCIILNTLLRKAAENGGVHPVYLDRISSEYARKIEMIASTASVQDLMTEMVRSYCRLVKKHSIRQYSPTVQKTIACIESDLSADLGLKALADMQNINASYLSAMFKKETGQTITDYVNQRRVQAAVQLLSTTKLQIQTIAQHCGIPDVNYFSKIFRKYMDKSPKEYRKEVQLRITAKK